MRRDMWTRMLAAVLCLLMVVACVPANVLSVYAVDMQGESLWAQVGNVDKETGGAWQSKGNYGSEQAILLGRKKPSQVTGWLDRYTANYNYSYFGNGASGMALHTNTSADAIVMDDTSADSIARLGSEMWHWRGRDKDGFVTNTPALEDPAGYTGTTIQYNTYTPKGNALDSSNAALMHFSENPLSSNMKYRNIMRFDVPESKADKVYYFTVYTNTLSFAATYSDEFQLSFTDLSGNPLGEKITLDAGDFGKSGGYATFMVKGSFLLHFDKTATNSFFGLSAFFFDEEDPYLWRQFGKVDTTTGGAWHSVGNYGDEQAIILGWANDSGGDFVNNRFAGTKGSSWWQSANHMDWTGSHKFFFKSNSAAGAPVPNMSADAGTRWGSELWHYLGQDGSANTTRLPALEMPENAAATFLERLPTYNTYTTGGSTASSANAALFCFNVQPLASDMSTRRIMTFTVPKGEEYYFTVYTNTLAFKTVPNFDFDLFLTDLNGNSKGGRVRLNTGDFGTTGGYITFRIKGSFMLFMDLANGADTRFGLSAFFFDKEAPEQAPEVEEVRPEGLWEQSGAIDTTTGGAWQTAGYGTSQAILLGWNAANTMNSKVDAMSQNSGYREHRYNYAELTSLENANWIKNLDADAIEFVNDGNWRTMMGKALYMYKGSDSMGAPTLQTKLETPAEFTGIEPWYNTYMPVASSTMTQFADVVPFTDTFTRRLAMRFNLPDAETEYSFRIYADTKYTQYKGDAPVRFSFVSPSGEKLYSSTTVQISEFTKNGGYINFKVKGSFVLLLDKTEYNADKQNSYFFGPSAFFFDPYEAPETSAPVEDKKDKAYYAFADSDTAGAGWQDVYGGVDAVLLGYNFSDTVSDTFYIDRVTHDYIKNGKIRTQFDGDKWFCYAASGNAVLYNPNTPANTFAVYSGGGISANSGSTLHLMHPLMDGYGRNKFTFSGLDEDQTYLFTVYSDYGNDFDAKNAGNVVFTFLDADCNVTYQRTVTTDDFKGGTYMSFVVKGGFTLMLDKQSKVSNFGLSGFFFDEVSENFVSALAVSAGSQKRSAKLTWTETGAVAGDVVVIERRTGSGEWTVVTELAAGVLSYTDTELRSGTTYSYRIYTRSGNRASYVTEPVSITTEPYTATELTLDKAEYSVKDDETAITVTAALKTKAGAACAGVPVYLELDFGHSVQSVPGVTTNTDGNASFTFLSEYMGSAVLRAYTLDDDAQKYAATNSEDATVFVGETQWTQAPVAFQISDAVAPGDLVNINGYGFFNEDMTLMRAAYAPHTGSNVAATPIVTAQELELVQTDDRDGYYIVTRLPEDAAPGLYDIWVYNGYGWSKPVTLNAARPLFMSEYEAWVGQSLTISGRCMEGTQFGAKLETKVRLVNGSNVYGVTLTKVTPYSIVFTVKEGTPLATYQVEVSNDGGVTWVELDSKQTLTVVAKGNDPLNTGLAWMDHFEWNNRFDVTSYGATKGDTTDDTTAVKSAIAAAKAAGGGVVYFPNGTYYLKRVTIPSYVVLIGESKEGTFLVYNDTNYGNMFSGNTSTRDEGHIGFANFTLKLADDAKRPDVFFWMGESFATENVKYPENRTASEFFVVNICMDYSHEPYVGGSRGAGTAVVGKERFLVQNCNSDCYGGSFVAISALTKYAIIRNNNFVFDSGCIYTDAMYSFIQDNYLSGHFGEASAEIDDGRNTHGICFQGFAHVEDNLVENVGSAVGGNVTNIHNDGETYLAEPIFSYDFGYVVGSTDNSIKVKLTSGKLRDDYECDYDYLSVVIHDGRGMGQVRRVASIDVDAETVTVTEPWDVNPDYTSKFTFLTPSEKTTLYNNEDRNSAKGVYIFGNMYDTVVANHKSTDTEGIFMYASHVWTSSSKRVWTNFYTTVRDCRVEGVSARSGYGNISAGSERAIDGGKYYGVENYAIEIRNNVIIGDPDAPVGGGNTEGVRANGIAFTSAGNRGNTDGYAGDTTNMVIENNRLEDVETGISYGYTERGMVAEGNTFVNVTTPYYQKEDKFGVMDTLTVVRDSLGSDELSYFTQLWKGADGGFFCESGIANLNTAVLQAEGTAANAPAAQLDDAMRTLRNAYRDLQAHTWDSGVVTAEASLTSLQQITYTCTLCGEEKVESVPRAGALWSQVGVMDTATGGAWQTKGYGTEQAMLLGWNGATELNDRTFSYGNGTTAYKWTGNTCNGATLHINTSSNAIKMPDTGIAGQRLAQEYWHSSTLTAKGVPTETSILDAPKNYTGEKPNYNSYTAMGCDANSTISFYDKIPLSGGYTHRVLAQFNVPDSKANKEYYFTVYANTAGYINTLDTTVEIFFADLDGNLMGEKITVSTKDLGRTGGYLTFKVKGSFLFGIDKNSSAYNFGLSAFFFDTAAVQQEPETKDKVNSASITLDGTIGVNYGVNLSLAAKQDSGAKMILSQMGKEDLTTDISSAKQQSRLYWFSRGVAAKEMTDQIVAQMHYSDGSVGGENPYTVQTYAHKVLTVMPEGKLADLLISMLNYGAMSQINFSYNTDNLANSVLYTDVRTAGINKVTAEDLKSYSLMVDAGSAAAPLKSASLLLKSGTILRLSFLDTDVQGKTFKYNGKALNVTDRSGIYSYVDIENIAAAELGDVYTVQVYEGDTLVSTVKYCPLAYGYTALTVSQDTNLHNTVKALYLYYKAADAYFNG